MAIFSPLGPEVKEWKELCVQSDSCSAELALYLQKYRRFIHTRLNLAPGPHTERLCISEPLHWKNHDILSIFVSYIHLKKTLEENTHCVLVLVHNLCMTLYLSMSLYKNNNHKNNIEFKKNNNMRWWGHIGAADYFLM